MFNITDQLVRNLLCKNVPDGFNHRNLKRVLINNYK